MSAGEQRCLLPSVISIAVVGEAIVYKMAPNNLSACSAQCLFNHTNANQQGIFTQGFLTDMAHLLTEEEDQSILTVSAG